MYRRRDTLTKFWRKLWQEAEYSSAGFSTGATLNTLRNKFQIEVRKKRFAIPFNVFSEILENILDQGRMSVMNAAAWLCINSNSHEKSGASRLQFLKNFIDLYTAETWEECARIEGLKPGSKDYEVLAKIALENIEGSKTPKEKNDKEAVKQITERLEKVKTICWLRDVTQANPQVDFTFLQKIVFGSYNEHAAAKLDADDKEAEENAKAKGLKVKKDLVALPKKDFIKLLSTAKNTGNISETQCGLMLMFVLHSREKRHGGASYIYHPVAVAKLVALHGGKFLDNSEPQIWMATIAALLHDAWEENDINSIREDLKGLLPRKIIDAVVALHKKEGEPYFEYLQRVARNRLAAVVKLCDLSNNSADMDLENGKGKSKQAYVYAIAANYMKYRLENPKNDISVEEFVKQEKVCSEKDFARITEIAESEDGIDENQNPVKALKKRDAMDAEFKDLQHIPSSVTSAKDILTTDKPRNANPRREKDTSLHLRPDV